MRLYIEKIKELTVIRSLTPPPWKLWMGNFTKINLLLSKLTNNFSVT